MNNNLDQIKKRIKNLDYEYHQDKAKMASTREKGAKKVQANCSFYSELDEKLGTQEVITTLVHTAAKQATTRAGCYPCKNSCCRTCGHISSNTNLGPAKCRASTKIVVFIEVLVHPRARHQL